VLVTVVLKLKLVLTKFSGPAFSRADKMRFSTLTYEIIEELKMRRELAVENEKKIEKLINERYNMGWKLVT
jgi:hypothetical protein